MTIHLGRYDVLTIGRNVVFNDAFLDTNAPITIENDVFFGWGVKVLTGSHDYRLRGVERQRSLTPKPVWIGEGAWIASYTILLPGSRIGRHSVVAAGSVVSGEVAPGCVYGGNPANLIKPIAFTESWE